MPLPRPKTKTVFALVLGVGLFVLSLAVLFVPVVFIVGESLAVRLCTYGEVIFNRSQYQTAATAAINLKQPFKEGDAHFTSWSDLGLGSLRPLAPAIERKAIRITDPPLIGTACHSSLPISVTQAITESSIRQKQLMNHKQRASFPKAVMPLLSRSIRTGLWPKTIRIKGEITAPHSVAYGGMASPRLNTISWVCVPQASPWDRRLRRMKEDGHNPSK